MESHALSRCIRLHALVESAPKVKDTPPPPEASVSAKAPADSFTVDYDDGLLPWAKLLDALDLSRCAAAENKYKRVRGQKKSSYSNNTDLPQAKTSIKVPTATIAPDGNDAHK